MGIHHILPPCAGTALKDFFDQLLKCLLIIGIALGNLGKGRPDIGLVYLMAGKTVAFLHPKTAQMVIRGLEVRVETDRVACQNSPF